MRAATRRLSLIHIFINCDRELILPLLREDEQLREELIWGMLAVEGNRDVSLTQRDSYKPGQKVNNPGWSCALIEATETGLISRDRLIDALLSSLMSDFPACLLYTSRCV